MGPYLWWIRKPPLPDARLRKGANKIGGASLDFKVTEEHEFLAYRKAPNRVYCEYIDGDKEVKK
jgi:hypothetical protein